MFSQGTNSSMTLNFVSLLSVEEEFNSPLKSFPWERKGSCAGCVVPTEFREFILLDRYVLGGAATLVRGFANNFL